MISKIKPIFIDKLYLLIFLGMSAISFAAFFITTMLFSWSRFLFFNYFLIDAIDVVISTFIVAAMFSVSFGFLSSFIAYNFKAVIGKRLREFLIVSIVIYIISYLLMLAKSSFSLFTFTQTSGPIYTAASLLLLAIILPLSGLLIINIYSIIKDIKRGVSGVGGITAAMFSLGCPSCGALLLSLVGVTAGLTIFPLQGLELKLFSVGLLGFATYKISNSKNCPLPKMENNLKSEHQEKSLE